jgi:hypothetical protein
LTLAPAYVSTWQPDVEGSLGRDRQTDSKNNRRRCAHRGRQAEQRPEGTDRWSDRQTAAHPPRAAACRACRTRCRAALGGGGRGAQASTPPSRAGARRRAISVSTRSRPGWPRPRPTRSARTTAPAASRCSRSSSLRSAARRGSGGGVRQSYSQRGGGVGRPN